MRPLRYLWALPTSLLGAPFIAIALASGGRVEIVNGVLEVHGGVLASFLRACPLGAGGASAMTLGHVVLGRDCECLAATRQHERAHVRQCERWGPAFIPAYLAAGLWAAMRGKGAYHGNYFERQARAEASPQREKRGDRLNSVEL